MDSNTFNLILLARNDFANKLETLSQSLGLGEQEQILILESILNDTRMKCMTREAYKRVTEDAKKNQPSDDIEHVDGEEIQPTSEVEETE